MLTYIKSLPPEDWFYLPEPLKNRADPPDVKTVLANFVLLDLAIGS